MLVSGPEKDRGTNALALGADIISLAIPCATGMGMMIRGGRAVDNIVDGLDGAMDFDAARRRAFDNAFGPGLWDDNPNIVPTKWDPATGTAVEFTGPGHARVPYDGPHPLTEGAHHDVQHVGWQSAGKRDAGGRRGNIPYVGPRHPSRPGR
jgi:hypothetical protein